MTCSIAWSLNKNCSFNSHKIVVYYLLVCWKCTSLMNFWLLLSFRWIWIFFEPIWRISYSSWCHCNCFLPGSVCLQWMVSNPLILLHHAKVGSHLADDPFLNVSRVCEGSVWRELMLTNCKLSCYCALSFRSATRRFTCVLSLIHVVFWTLYSGSKLYYIVGCYYRTL